MISGLNILLGGNDDPVRELHRIASTHPSWADDLRGIDAEARQGEVIGDTGLRSVRLASGPDVLLCSRCASTMDLAFDLFRADALPPWGAVVCVEQDGGRGQLRRHWVSPPGNLHVSFLLPDQSEPAWNRILPLVVGSLLREAFGRLGATLELKWPNDLVQWQDSKYRKTCGLLIEDRGGATVCGFGANLSHAPDDAQLRVDSSFSAGVIRFFDGRIGQDRAWGSGPLALWRELVNSLKRDYHMMLFDDAPEAFVKRLSGSILWSGREVVLREGAENRRGRIVGLSSDGGLLVDSGNGVETIYSGSILELV